MNDWKPDGDLFTMSDFTAACLDGSFINYDGHGYYSDGKSESKDMVRPSDVVSGLHNSGYSHVVWYNR